MRELAAQLPADARRVDLGGRVVLPGFVDGHCHLELTTMHLAYAVSCFAPPHASLEEICRSLAARATGVAPGAWIVGRANFSLDLWVDEHRTLSRADLDPVTPDHPTVVFTGLHQCTLNTRALEVTGLLSEPPPRGATLDGPSGRAMELWAQLPLPSYGVDATAAALRGLGTELFTRHGVTSIAEIPFTSDGIRAYQALHRRGELPFRLGLWYHVPRLCDVDDLAGLGLEGGFGDDWLSLGGVKIFVDGAGFDATGNDFEHLQWTQEELDHAVWTAHAAGLQVLMHVAPTSVRHAPVRLQLRRRLTRPGVLPALDASPHGLSYPWQQRLHWDATRGGQSIPRNLVRRRSPNTGRHGGRSGRTRRP